MRDHIVDDDSERLVLEAILLRDHIVGDLLVLDIILLHDHIVDGDSEQLVLAGPN